jgi:site-specific DNA-methyltransferase (adenine-specific)
MHGVPSASVDLVYFDPPRNTAHDFFDVRTEPLDAYRAFMRPRIAECRRVLKSTGVIAIHVDPSVSHHFRDMCDAAFGATSFQNEIVWQSDHHAKNEARRFHDTILVYAGGAHPVFRPLFTAVGADCRSPSPVIKCPTSGRRFVTTEIFTPRPDVNPRPHLVYMWRGHMRQWMVSEDKMRALDARGRLAYSATGFPRLKRFLDEVVSAPMRDVWTDIADVGTNERMAYPSQKPVALLERLVKLYTLPGSLCLDIFAGSGTLGRAARRCGRRCLLFDQNPAAKDIFMALSAGDRGDASS